MVVISGGGGGGGGGGVGALVGMGQWVGTGHGDITCVLQTQFLSMLKLRGNPVSSQQNSANHCLPCGRRHSNVL